jgi:hypothetical protein
MLKAVKKLGFCEVTFGIGRAIKIYNTVLLLLIIFLSSIILIFSHLPSAFLLSALLILLFLRPFGTVLLFRL